MKKILIASILLTLVASSGAFAWSARWNALGGDHRFVIDTTNYTIYPGRITLFGNALFVIPVPKGDVSEFYDQRYFVDNGITSGALVNVKNMTLALHYNLPSAGAKNLRSALAGFKPEAKALGDAESDLRRADKGTPEWYEARKEVARIRQNIQLADLDIKPFPDLFWGMKMGKLSLGARLAVVMDSTSDAATMFEEPIKEDETAVGMETRPVEEITTSAKALDLSLGATMYETPAGDLDLGLRAGLQSFAGEDPNEDIKIESTGGMDLAFDARLNKPLGKGKKDCTLISLLGVNVGSVPSAVYDEVAASNVTEASYMKGDVGIGFRDKIKDKATLIAGVVGGYGATTYKSTTTIEKEPAEKGGEVTIEKKELPETTDTSLNATVLAGCELPITRWLIMHGGVNVKFASITNEIVLQKVKESWLGEGEEETEDVVGQKKSTSVDYYYNMGFRAIISGLIVDVVLARNIVHRGPYFLTGASGTWGTEVCVTYRF